MNIFLDESGSFVSSTRQNSWNCIVAYLSPETDRKQLREALACLKRAAGVTITREIKLRDLRESDYFDFLDRLGKLHGVVFTVATDAGLNRVADIVEHQKGQAIKMLNIKAECTTRAVGKDWRRFPIKLECLRHSSMYSCIVK